MSPLGWSSLAILLAVVGPSAAAEQITIYRCQDSGGAVTLQDEPCPAGQTATSRSMQRPQDPPSRAATPPTTDAASDRDPDDGYAPMPPPTGLPWPPPPMFQCTDYDGEVRFSEDYSPNTRCVPLSVLGYRMQDGSDAAATCRWVQESCLRIDDQSACVQFRAKLKQARSDALHAFSDTAAYRKSEAERLARIVDESCR